MPVAQEESTIASFLDYKQVVLTLATDLARLQDYATRLGLQHTTALIAEVRERVSQETFTVAIVGEFKRGKSTFINALLGEDILPTDILPTTATLNRVVYGIEKGVQIRFKNGAEDRIPIDRLPDYVTKLTSKAETTAASIDEAVVYYPAPYCQNNVQIIDTPGLNDDNAMTAVTMSVLPRVDAAILVILAQAPLAETERDFLEKRLLTSDLGRVIFVVTKIDQLGPGEADRVIEFIRGRINDLVLKRAAEQYGKDSEEYKVYVRKIGEPKVFGLAPKPALDAKLAHDRQGLEASRYPEFEKALERFLTQERGAIVLQVPVNRLVASSTEVLEAINVRESALKMELHQFDDAYKEASATLEALHKRKLDELQQIDQSAQAIQRAIRPLVNGLDEALRTAASEAIDTYAINAADLSDQTKFEQFKPKLDGKIEQAVLIASRKFAERIQTEIQRGVAREEARLKSFTSDLDQTLHAIDITFTSVNTKAVEKRSIGVEGAIAVVSLWTGFGGIWSGYREAGSKGALVGAAASLGTWVGVGMLMGALALPLSAPLLIGGIALSFFTGGKVTEWLFRGERVEQFREDYRAKVLNALRDEVSSAGIVNEVNEQVASTFRVMRDQVDREVEALINTTQKTLDEVRTRREKGEALSDEETKELADMRTEAQRIQGNAYRLADQLIQKMSV